jgi:hypothetical protein
MELNLIYEQMREDNRIFELKDNSAKRSSRDFNAERNRKSLGNIHSANNSNSFIGSNLASTGNNQQAIHRDPNSALFLKLKSENKEELYLQYRNFITLLKMSEFI